MTARRLAPGRRRALTHPGPARDLRWPRAAGWWRAWLTGLALCACAVLGCEAVDKVGAAAGQACNVGDPEACSCSDGRTATRVCLPGGGYSACGCDVDGRCEPGIEQACTCPDGGSGSLVCLADGSTSPCRCDDSSAPVNDAGGGADTPPPGTSGGAAQSCCNGIGTCVPASVIPEEQAGFVGPDSCVAAESQRCVPDALSNPAGFQLPSCRSTGGAEGRCVPQCLPQVAAQAALLPRDLCEPFHVCAPCFDPFSGTDTMLCGLSNDPGPQEPPLVFERCCSDTGACLPADTLPADQRDFLGQDSCEAGQLCAPEVLGDPSGFRLASCRAAGDAEGRCVPECLPQVQEQAAFLGRDRCNAAELCVPCFDPLSGADTTICSLGNDPGPVEPPVVWEKCCVTEGAPLGTCVPASLLPEDQADAIPQQSCPDSDQRCVPDAQLADPSTPPRACTSALVDEGICALECLVTGLGGLLPRGDCESGERCVPAG